MPMQATRSEGLRASLPLPPLGRAGSSSASTTSTTCAPRSPRRPPPSASHQVESHDLVAAASELAANSILHGGGRGLATIWGENSAAFVEVADAGTITDPEVGTRLPDPKVEHGRGLYIANRLCDEVSIDSGEPDPGAPADGDRATARTEAPVSVASQRQQHDVVAQLAAGPGEGVAA